MPKPAPAPKKQGHWSAQRIHRFTVGILIAVMAVELVLTLLKGQWLTSFLVVMIMSVALGPVIFSHRLRITFPAEFHLLAIIFIFASLFMGEVWQFYERLWWWDVALHASSGLLFGIFGFLLVYALNEDRHADLHMRPGFVAFFAFLFAVAAGGFWEIFEYSMDSIFGMNMQKPMWNDPSGLTDTMWDMIVNTVGALIISLLGWSHLKSPRESFLEAWIRKFIESNPRLFRS
ncbi:MAG: hypothetical protein PSX71_13765 [bacterium]|nr:hypothetical protein [bacterium]